MHFQDKGKAPTLLLYTSEEMGKLGTEVEGAEAMGLRRNVGWVALSGLLLVALPAAAHHSFSMFDMSKQVTLTGSVTSFEWTNPHVYIEIDVPADAGTVKHWSIELGSPSILRNSGWKHDTLKAGDKVTVIVNPLKNGNSGGFLVQANLPDNRKLGNGPGREANNAK